MVRVVRRIGCSPARAANVLRAHRENDIACLPDTGSDHRRVWRSKTAPSARHGCPVTGIRAGVDDIRRRRGSARRFAVWNVQYVGSPHHKRRPWFGQNPSTRSDKTECPSDLDPSHVVAVLQAAIADSIRALRHSIDPEGVPPRYVWGRSEFMTTAGRVREIVWEARCSNRDIPAYHAYPIRRDRHSDTMPIDVEEQLWPDE